MRARETSVQDTIVKMLKAREHCWYMKIVGNSHQKSGVPDLLVIYRGYAIPIEVKRPGERPAPLQEATVLEMLEAGAFAIITDDPAYVKTVLDWIERLPFSARRHAILGYIKEHNLKAKG
jgi:hypothetical protein